MESHSLLVGSVPSQSESHSHAPTHMQKYTHVVLFCLLHVNMHAIKIIEFRISFYWVEISKCMALLFQLECSSSLFSGWAEETWGSKNTEKNWRYRYRGLIDNIWGFIVSDASVHCTPTCYERAREEVRRGDGRRGAYNAHDVIAAAIIFHGQYAEARYKLRIFSIGNPFLANKVEFIH